MTIGQVCKILCHFVAEARKFFDDLCVKHEVDCSPPRTIARLLDKVCLLGVFLRVNLL